MTMTRSVSSSSLRTQAEEKFSMEESISSTTLSLDEVQQLLHELRVHQIELEIQNEDLRRTQVELETSRARYFNLYDLAPVGYLTISDKGLIREANLTVASLLGVSRGVLAGQSLAEYILKEHQDVYYLYRKQLFETGKSQECDLQMVKLDSISFWVHLKACVAQDEDGETICRIVLSDITNQKLAEESLQVSEEHYRLLAETMLQGVVHQDASGKVISMNPAAERILGKSREEFLGSSSVDDEHDTIRENGEISPWMEHPAMVALRTGLPVRGVVMGVFNPKLQEYRWLGIDAVPVFRPGENFPSEVYSVFGDITDRKNDEKALQESEHRIQQALRVSRSFTFEWSPVTDRVKRSASCAAILNLTGDEAVNDTGAHYFQCVHPADRERFVQILRDLTPTADSYTVEYRYVCKYGSEITLEETGQASFDAGGKMLRLVGVSSDISTRKKAEEELIKANDELELRIEERTSELAKVIKVLEKEILERKEAEKSLFDETSERIRTVEELREKEQILIQQSRLAAMGDMINNIAHQWRQPLNVLGLISQQMQLYYEMGTFNKEYLDESVKKSMNIINHMSRTIDDFRDFFKPDKDKVEFAIIDVVSKTVTLVEDSFSSQQITIESTVMDTPVVFGYPNEYSQVLLNILMNAKDAFMENRPSTPKIIVTINREDERSVVTIADNAGGIPEENLFKIFEPYFTTKGPDKGTGVGLFMSKTIIEKNMGGRLTARNTDNGAEFRIEV